MRISILRDDVISQIAAGEVIERPASVVKELVENAIDANATEIIVRIENAGKGLVEVADNGYGIGNDEIQLSVTRHATSKLSTADDLFKIGTLGFRGEALASIASVSQFELVSRDEASEIGGRVQVEGGQIVKVEKAGVPVGTVVTVRNIFFNTPARLKFLKSETTEKQRISGLLTRFALAYPNIRFQLFIDQHPSFQTSGNGDRREILAHLYGPDIAKKMLSVTLEENEFQLSGFISPIAITRSNRREITFFVNGRWVQDAALTAALTRAYHTMIMVGRYPMAIMFLELPADQVDVNVHPTKAEVRFSQPDYVFSLVQRGVRRALLAYSPVPEIQRASWTSSENQDEGQHAFHWRPATALEVFDQDKKETAHEGQSDDTGQPDQAIETESRFAANTMPLLRLVGQIGAAYIVAEGPDGLYLIDQHAAHERVLFEKLMEQTGRQVPAQALLTPEVVNLPPHQAQIIEENLQILRQLGFEVENFGPNAFQIRSIPQLLIGMNPAAAIRVIIEDFEDDEKPLQGQTEAIIAARVCKRAAVKAGQVLTREEQAALLRDLEHCSSPRTCPHGRPTMIHLSVGLLEKQFGRKGSL